MWIEAESAFVVGCRAAEPIAGGVRRGLKIEAVHSSKTQGTLTRLHGFKSQKMAFIRDALRTSNLIC
jgi:hypothetical protein